MLAPDSPERFQAATLFALREASLSRGHVYVTEEQLAREINVLLTPQGKDLFSSSERKKYLERMAQEERIVEDHGKYYLPSLFYAEHGAAIRVRDWLEQKLEPFGFFRCHKSYLVNLASITEMKTWVNGAYNLLMDDARRSCIPVSRNYVKMLRLKLEI